MREFWRPTFHERLRHHHGCMYLNTTFYVIAFGVQTSQPQQVQLKQTSATETNASGNELTTPATVQGNRSQTEKDTVESCMYINIYYNM